MAGYWQLCVRIPLQARWYTTLKKYLQTIRGKNNTSQTQFITQYWLFESPQTFHDFVYFLRLWWGVWGGDTRTAQKTADIQQKLLSETDRVLFPAVQPRTSQPPEGRRNPRLPETIWARKVNDCCSLFVQQTIRIKPRMNWTYCEIWLGWMDLDVLSLCPQSLLIYWCCGGYGSHH